MVKNIKKLYHQRFFFHNINQSIAKTRNEMLATFMGMTSFMPNSKLCNFISSRKMIKTPHIFVKGFFPYEINNKNEKKKKKKKKKTGVEFWPQFLIKTTKVFDFLLILGVAITRKVLVCFSAILLTKISRTHRSNKMAVLPSLSFHGVLPDMFEHLQLI